MKKNTIKLLISSFVFICFMILNNDHKVFGRLNEDNNGRLYCDSSNNEMTYQIDDNLISESDTIREAFNLWSYQSNFEFIESEISSCIKIIAIYEEQFGFNSAFYFEKQTNYIIINLFKFSELTDYEKIYTVSHEIGHFFGYEDSLIMKNVMNPTYGFENNVLDIKIDYKPNGLFENMIYYSFSDDLCFYGDYNCFINGIHNPQELKFLVKHKLFFQEQKIYISKIDNFSVSITIHKDVSSVNKYWIEIITSDSMLLLNESNGIEIMTKVIYYTAHKYYWNLPFNPLRVEGEIRLHYWTHNLYSGSEKMDIGNETGYRIYLDGIAGYIFGLLF